MATLENEKPKFEYRAGNAVAFLSSLVFHVALLLALACWVYSAGKPSQGLLLSADFGDSQDTALDLVQTFEILPQLDEPAQELTDPEFSMKVDIGNLSDDSADDPAAKLGAALTSVSIGDVVDNLNLQGRGRGASFFGSYAQGNRFVYVLDSSRSMQGDRWMYACNQLLDSLKGLRSGQEFFVICFDLQTSFLFNVPPQQANFLVMDEDDNEIVERVRRWLRSRTLGPATMPADALRYALEMNPDAIFLLSDGELQDNSLFMLRLLNSVTSEHRQIPIHTVHLFSLDGRRTLQQIAYENSGNFSPISDR